MAAIYEQAHISICEELSPGGDHTFFAPRSPGLDPIFLKDVFIDGYRKSIKARRSRTGGMHVYQDDVPSARDPLDRRGWACQERTLSTRLIAYSRDELQWMCKTLSTCECENPMQGALSLHSLQTVQDVYRFREGQVGEYTRRSLTYPHDKLPALAAKVSETTGSDYVAGLWKSNLIRDLLWG